MGWLDDAEKRAETAHDANSVARYRVIREDAPRAYALIRQLGDDLGRLSDWHDRGDQHANQETYERFLADREHARTTVAAFREATEDR